MTTTETPEHLTQMVREHWREVYALLVVITRHPPMAEDLAQEVFLLAHRKQVRADDGVRHWLRAAARRLAMNELRRKRPEAVTPSELEYLADADAALDATTDGDEFAERLAALRSCLDEVPATDRALLTARYEANVTLARIAEEHRQSVGYIKQRLFRLRQKLAECVRRKTAQSLLTHANA